MVVKFTHVMMGELVLLNNRLIRSYLFYLYLFYHFMAFFINISFNIRYNTGLVPLKQQKQKSTVIFPSKTKAPFFYLDGTLRYDCKNNTSPKGQFREFLYNAFFMYKELSVMEKRAYHGSLADLCNVGIWV